MSFVSTGGDAIIERMPRVWVDADACPRKVLAILNELREAIGFELFTVSSLNHRISSENHLMVDTECQSTDLALLNRVVSGDLVITQDWGLAAMIIGKKGRVISPKGFIFTEENIDFMLEERHIKAVLRRNGQRTKGPSARTKADDERFRDAMLRVWALAGVSDR